MSSSPYLNRFLQPDTIIPDVATPQSWNRYSYVTNNPIRYNDPTGHKKCDEEYNCSGKPSTPSETVTPESLLKKYNVTIDKKFSDKEKWAIAYGVILVGHKFAKERNKNESGAGAFNAVFDKGINFVSDPQCNACRHGTIYKQKKDGWEDTGEKCGSNYTSPGCVPGGGFTAGTTITFASMSGQMSNALSRMAKNVVHEVGHVYYHSVLDGPILGNSFSRDALRPNEPDGLLDWQQHPDADGPELFADTFIAWTYDAWNPSPPKTNPLAADNAKSVMDALVPKP